MRVCYELLKGLKNFFDLDDFSNYRKIPDISQPNLKHKNPSSYKPPPG